jgi:hypothetical protein
MVNKARGEERSGCDEKTGVDLQGDREFSEHRHARGNAAALDRADVPQAEPGQPGDILLGQVPLVAKVSEIFRQNVLQIHAKEIMEQERKC